MKVNGDRWGRWELGQGEEPLRMSWAVKPPTSQANMTHTSLQYAKWISKSLLDQYKVLKVEFRYISPESDVDLVKGPYFWVQMNFWVQHYTTAPCTVASQQEGAGSRLLSHLWFEKLCTVFSATSGKEIHQCQSVHHCADCWIRRPVVCACSSCLYYPFRDFDDAALFNLTYGNRS